MIIALIFALGCTSIDYALLNDSSELSVEGIDDSLNQSPLGIKIIFSSPISEFSDDDISYLGINCSGEDSQIADCINEWEKNNIIYNAFEPDSSYSIRWNYNFPGIYPSSEIIREKINNDGKIYGVCFDYAVIYCSIAEYYGIECRVMNSITKPSDKDPSLLEYASGLGIMEYNDLKMQFRAKGVDYPYEIIRQIMKETPEHYWAEAKIGAEWIIYDATNEIIEGSDTKKTYVDSNDYEITLWENDYALNILIGYSPKVDDLGESEKSWTIDDYFGSKMSGQAMPVPYYESCDDACGFFIGKNPACQYSCVMDSSFFNCYESCSSQKFYKICDYICEDDGYESCYYECSGHELNIECFESC
jgi:hypothetical protein